MPQPIAMTGPSERSRHAGGPFESTLHQGSSTTPDKPSMAVEQVDVNAGDPDPGGPDTSASAASDTDDSVETDSAIVDGAETDLADAAASDSAVVDGAEHGLTEVVTDLASQLERFHERASAQEALIAKMHARIEVLQSGETKKLLKPVSTQLIALYSDLEDTASSLRPDTSVDQFVGLLSNFSLSVEQILDNLGLTSLQTSAGDGFEPRLHHAIKKVDTNDAALDRTVAEVLRQGFIEPGEAKPLVPSRVSVYRYEGSPSASASTADSGEQ